MIQKRGRREKRVPAAYITQLYLTEKCARFSRSPSVAFLCRPARPRKFTPPFFLEFSYAARRLFLSAAAAAPRLFCRARTKKNPLTEMSLRIPGKKSRFERPPSPPITTNTLRATIFRVHCRTSSSNVLNPTRWTPPPRLFGLFPSRCRPHTSGSGIRLSPVPKSTPLAVAVSPAAAAPPDCGDDPAVPAAAAGRWKKATLRPGDISPK